MVPCAWRQKIQFPPTVYKTTVVGPLRGHRPNPSGKNRRVRWIPSPRSKTTVSKTAVTIAGLEQRFRSRRRRTRSAQDPDKGEVGGSSSPRPTIIIRVQPGDMGNRMYRLHG